MTSLAEQLSREDPIDGRFIGASDIPSLIGLSDLPGRAALYNRLKWRIDPPRTDWLNEAGALGKRCELAIATVAAERMGLDPRRLVKPPSVINPGGLRWARFSLDPAIPDGPRSPVIFEVKMRPGWSLAAQGWGEPDTAEVAPSVLAQVQAQMAFLRADRDRWVGTNLPDVEQVVVVVAVNGASLRLYPVPRDEAMGEALLEAAERFWVDHVEGDRPLPLDGTIATTRALLARHPAPNGTIRVASDEERRLAEELLVVQEVKREAVARLELAKQRLQQAIGDDLGVEAPGVRVKWSARRGQVAHDEVAAELAARLGLTRDELREIEERHRAEPYRCLEVKRTEEDEE